MNKAKYQQLTAVCQYCGIRLNLKMVLYFKNLNLIELKNQKRINTMAEILKANCRICNYDTSFRYGGGRFDFQTFNPVPAYDKTTEELESVNYKLEKDNPDYIFYTDEQLKGDNEGKYIFQNFDLKLNQVNNYCPKCKNYSLDFRSYMFC